MSFSRAVKKALTIKIALSGPSGSGKTFSALRLATGLGGKIAVLDTEGNSASYYADIFKFDTYDERDKSGYPPEFFIKAISDATAAGYNTLIIDSLSHAWAGRGGCLEIAEKLSQTQKYKNNSFAVWREVTPRQNALINAIITARINIIATMRTKTAYARQEDNSGKTKISRVGTEAIQGKEIEYEFGIVFNLQHGNLAEAEKDRTGLFVGEVDLITEQTGEKITQWLTSTPEEMEKIRSDYAARRKEAEAKAQKQTQGRAAQPEPKQATQKTTPAKRAAAGKKEQPIEERAVPAREFIISHFADAQKRGYSARDILDGYKMILNRAILDRFEDLSHAEIVSLATAIYEEQKKGAK